LSLPGSEWIDLGQEGFREFGHACNRCYFRHWGLAACSGPPVERDILASATSSVAVRLCAPDHSLGLRCDRALRDRGLRVRMGLWFFPISLRVRREFGPTAADLRCLDARRPGGGSPSDRVRNDILCG